MTKNQKVVLTVVALALSLVFFLAGVNQAEYYSGTKETWGLLIGLGFPVLILGGVAYLWTLRTKGNGR